ncbi:hypothetical protein PCANC_01958 [Puccinia coronata f. sp. avenae]|uniref:Uncharacterized protein n=1 Tax=Puccinia coronata f. sp. avenae TaxID=200324 RepID=A0A2N5W4D9_9BASI|nr:hypothetical protein PCASD_00860 [Puccinia coronata f. sp. avenae]PLW57091.1 hypothetical protein PCANC_01958 [Puccinia coronata f. sp. avenae]
MQFSSFIALVALLLIQSQVAYSTFLCNDQSKFKSTVGYCMRKINTSDYIYKELRVWKKLGVEMIVMEANKAAPDSSGYTCPDTFLIVNRPVERRVCCQLPKSRATDGILMGYTETQIFQNCYARGT